MKIDDTVYGTIEIEEPVLIELINSKPLQRIKGVNQAGTQYVQTSRKVTRYDHCLGVMILLRKFGADLQEQIAGLLHDVPHTAFSHTIDFVFRNNNHDQDFHEKFLKKIVFGSEIPTILAKFNLDTNFIIDESNFPLLEQPIPALCADRIDYFLRDSIDNGALKDAKVFLSALSIHKGVFVFTNLATAKRFALDFMKQCREIWNSPQTLAAFELLAKGLRIALEKEVIAEEDLFQTDDFVFEKLKSSSDTEIRKLISLLTPEMRFIEDPADYDFQSRGKLRFVDPLILIKNSTVQLSDIDKEFKEEVENHRLKVEKGHFLKILWQG